MRAAGIDYGLSRVGLAVSDELGLLAHPRPPLDGRNMTGLIDSLKELARSEGIECFVVGLPRLLSGREGTSARRVRRFAQVLEQVSGVRVEFVDEWLTTKEAQARLREGGLDGRRSRSKIDGAAAALILQAWLDGNRPASDEEPA